MGLFQRLGRWAGVGLWLIVPTVALGLLPASVLDRGPSGDVRPTLFPFALGALDPFLWNCTRNSLVVAAFVSLLSLILGVNLARLVTRRSFWGRPILIALGVAPLVVPPMVGALGLRLLFGPWLETWRSGSVGSWFPWLCWVWVAMSTGVPLVALVTGASLSKLEPGWADAARQVGASRYQAWRKMVWPLVRPSVSHATATVFTLTLLDPGAPLLLGLRRTLAFQTVESLRTAHPFPRAAVLALMSLILAVPLRVLLRWWGGPSVPLAAHPERAHPEWLSWKFAAAAIFALLASVALVWLPIWGVMIAAVRPAWFGLAGTAGRLDGIGLWTFLGNSVVLGLGVVAMQLLMVAGLTANRGSRRRLPRILINWPEVFPPLALGVGALALPWLLGLLATERRASGQGGALVNALHWLEAALEPGMGPGLLMVLAVSTSLQPLLAGALGVKRGGFQPDQYDAARAHGASERRARRVATGLALANSPGVLCLTFCLAATSLAPALLFTRFSGSRTIAVGLVELVDEPGGGTALACRLAMYIIIANVFSLGLALRGRHDSAGQWLRPAS